MNSINLRYMRPRLTSFGNQELGHHRNNRKDFWAPQNSMELTDGFGGFFACRAVVFVHQAAAAVWGTGPVSSETYAQVPVIVSVWQRGY